MGLNGYIDKYLPLFRGHTPGHKGKRDKRDLTEILDDFPGDLIEKSEARTAKLYGAPYLRYLVGGSSIGIKASLLELGESFVTDFYRHRAVDEGARLAKVNVYYTPEAYDENGLPTLMTAQTLSRVMDETGARNALVQYPDYYGRVPDLQAISDVVKARGGKLLCDSAHGAHFALRPDLFPPSAHIFAHTCNMSAHKTLGAMTQTALLLAKERGGLDDKLDDLGTTSPNYILLASLEKGMAEAEDLRERYDALKVFAQEFADEFECLENDDFTRLVLIVRGKGEQTAYALRDEGVVCEKYDDDRVVFILTPYDDEISLRALVAGVRKVLKGKGK
ncbi:MAG: hypothetical protein IKM44_03345 [Clostridia bacterium]|nr:hypothetical protein [Clostridia bacterium]